MGFGFFQSLAAAAKPDILTYAVFLAAAFLVFDGRPSRRTIGLILVSILTPVKMIAVVFFPAFWLHDLWRHQFVWRSKRWLGYSTIGCIWIASIISLFLFNLRTLGAVFPPSHGQPSLIDLMLEVWRFVHDFFRAFLANWYGSIRPPVFLIVFALLVITALIALASLRCGETGRNARGAGMLVLSFSWALEFVRIFYADPRLMGYGILLVLVGCAPKSTASFRWLAYGAACLAAATLNAAVVESSGAGDRRYAAMAQAVEPFLDDTKPLYTNSQGLVDVHLGKRSIPIEALPATSEAACFLEVRLPNYDAVGAKVWPIKGSTETWTLIADVDGARLYCRP
jgi:hypothetical protein